MENEIERRDILKRGLVLTGLAALTSAQWPLPALAQGEELVPFTDATGPLRTGPPKPGENHIVDTRTLSDFYPPNDDFYVVQHYDQPELDLSDYRLRITGLVDNPMELSLDQIKRRAKVTLDAGFECGGNMKRFFYGLVGNAKWVGVNLSALLQESGVKPEGKEIVVHPCVNELRVEHAGLSPAPAVGDPGHEVVPRLGHRHDRGGLARESERHPACDRNEIGARRRRG